MCNANSSVIMSRESQTTTDDRLLERLRLDAAGPIVHVDYYRRDCRDALAEIMQLRKLVAALAHGTPTEERGDG